MSQNIKKRSEAAQRGGRRLAQEQTRHPREEARAEAKRREESRDSRDKTRVRAQTAVQEREDAVTQVRERPQTPHGRQGRKPKKDLQWLASMYLAAEHEMTRIRCRWRHIVREKRAHNFPESERLPIQMLLFVWSMIPMLGARVREVMGGRRRRSASRISALGAWMEGRRLHPVAFLCGACAMAAVAMFCSAYTIGTTVTYDGEVVAAVSSLSAAEDARSNLEQATARTLGESYTIDDSLIQYSSSLLKRQDVVDEAELEEDLSQEIGLVTSAYCLYVDGERIGATTYEGALEELLQQLKAASTNEGTISCEFAEEVEVRQEYVPTDEVMNLGYLAQTLYSTKTEEVTYEVKKGDTWSEIANSHGLTSQELLALNPGYNIDKLQIGEVLTLAASVPYLTLTVVEQERYVEDVPYDIEYTDSANLYKGDYKVISAGEYGAADVVANVTYVNGEETERTVLSSVMLREPVTEQQLRGTKERPTWAPTGTFRWPTSGRITSYFGGRKSPGGIGSTNHKGIDIANSYGTPIYAADGGTVIYSGWMSGYGYFVQIDHGNGYVTCYGHNSKLLDSVGQHVYKGQQIAKMGSTGNSTGNHCHFEIRYNGVAKNPLNYL